MTDRIPGAPGQFKAVISPDQLAALQNGEEFTIKLTRDDQPVVDGTPYCKEAVLPDDLAMAICPNIEDPCPADALAALLPKLGGIMAGTLMLNGIVLTEGKDFGDNLPETGVKGQLFFLKE